MLAPSQNFLEKQQQQKTGDRKTKGTKRWSPKQESTKKGIKGKSTVQNPTFQNESAASKALKQFKEEQKARPASAYLEKAEQDDGTSDKHKSIFHPSEEFMHQASAEKEEERLRRQQGEEEAAAAATARPTSTYLTSVDIRENHKSIFRPSSLFLSKAKADKQLKKGKSKKRKGKGRLSEVDIEGDI